MYDNIVGGLIVFVFLALFVLFVRLIVKGMRKLDRAQRDAIIERGMREGLADAEAEERIAAKILAERARR